MSIFDNNITNHDEYIESQFAVSMVKTPSYCLQHKYYGYMAEQLIAKGEDVEHYYGCKLLNLEIKVCSLWYIITGNLIDEYQLGVYLAKTANELKKKYPKTISYKSMTFYQDMECVEMDIAKVMYHDLHGHFGFNNHIRPWHQVKRYIKREPILKRISKLETEVW